MTETPKPKVPAPTEIIELVDVVNWRYVALALVAGAALAFIVLALVEHTDDVSAIVPGDDA
jgi:hypothetical protein